MLGRLSGLDHTQVHPFVGFDPLGELRARRSGDIETPLDLVRDAVLQYGFVGGEGLLADGLAPERQPVPPRLNRR